jgi:hypothetical protein
MIKAIFRLCGLSILLGSILVGPLLASDCDINCIASCRACGDTFLFGIRCTPPEPTCLSACLLKKGASCGVGATHKDQPIHGNYCGFGNRGGPPVDDLDAACKWHDECYDRVGRAACSCDKVLATRAAALAATDRNLSEVAREKAALTATFFSSTPCVPH